VEPREIPPYPESRPLALEDKPLLDVLFAPLQPRISELTFASLYLFRHAHGYRLARIGSAVVVTGRGYDGSPYVLPPLGGEIAAATVRLLEEGLTLYGADRPFLDANLPEGGYAAVRDRDNFDYLYLKSDLAGLPGNRYHKKRNRISYFLSRHQPEVEAFGDGHREGCHRLLDEWQRVRAGIESRSLLMEAAAAREGIELAGRLGLEGVVVLVDGAVKGFALGERLNRETAVCHFEKADPFLEGVYQLVDREFNRLLFTDCACVNREQDLGEANLRESKLSYHPVELVEKYLVRKETNRGGTG